MSLSPLKLPKDYIPDTRNQPIWSDYHQSKVLGRNTTDLDKPKAESKAKSIYKLRSKNGGHTYKGAKYSGAHSMWHTRFSRNPGEIIYLAYIARGKDSTLNEELDNIKKEFEVLYNVVQIRLKDLQEFFNVPLKVIAESINVPYQNVWVWTQRDKLKYNWALYIKMKKLVRKLDPYRWGRNNFELIRKYKYVQETK